MTDQSRSLIFRKRNVLGAALIAGIGMGVFLGKLPWIGNGGSGFLGFGTSNSGRIDSSNDNQGAFDTQTTDDTADIVGADGAKPGTPVVRVVIDEHNYLLKDQSNKGVIGLTELIDLVKKATGDRDGVRLRIYETSSARMGAEEDLKAALKDADIPDSAVIWVPPSIEK